MANWYVKRGTKTAGPLTPQRLKELAAQGKIQETDLVRKGEESNFIPAAQIPGLFPEPPSDFQADDIQQSEQSQTTAPKKNNTVLWIVLAVAGGGVVLVALLFIVVLLPAVQQGREAARRSTSKNHLKIIGIAMHNYHDTHRIFPPGGTETTDGKPYHSWQTSLLPHMEHASLYNQIDFDQPWSDPANQALFKQEIPSYLNPTISENKSPDGLGLSHYVGNQHFLKKNTGIQLRDITDGASNTIIAVEAGENFKPWGDPTNIADLSNIMSSGNKTAYKGGRHILMADGSVRFISENVDPETLKHLSIPDDGHIVGEF